MIKIEGKQIKYNMIKSVILKKILFKRLIINVENKNWTEDKRTLIQNIDRIILLNETGVSLTPGKDFDYKSGNKYIRFSYGGSYRDITVAIQKINNWLKIKK